jgi:hypothetical protein
VVVEAPDIVYLVETVRGIEVGMEDAFPTNTIAKTGEKTLRVNSVGRFVQRSHTGS